MYPKPIPPPFYNECEVDDCPAKNGDFCEYCLDLDDTLDSEDKSNEENEETKDS